MIILGGDKKKMAGLIVAKSIGGPKEEIEKEEKSEKESDESLLYAANSVMKAVEAKDLLALKDALKSFWEICDSSPHEEGEHY